MIEILILALLFLCYAFWLIYMDLKYDVADRKKPKDKRNVG